MQLLFHFTIKTLVDVRSAPTSRFPYFKKQNLKHSLIKAGIDYFYLGKELGGFRKGGYDYYTTTTPYKEGLKTLESIGTNNTTAFMCAEKLPWKCHRRFIARSLQENGWQVIHIIDEKRVWTPE